MSAMTHDKTDQPFADLEIRIFPQEDQGYPIEITLGGQQAFPRGYLEPHILPWVSSGVPEQDGQKLFEALLADTSLRSAWAEARGRSSQRRIRLRIDESAAELHALPWELLYEGSVMLSAQADTPFSRYLPIALPWGNPIQERPIRVLVAIANPDDLEDWYNLAPVDVALERGILESALADVASDQLHVDFLEAPVTLERLEEALRQGVQSTPGYHILHLVGHGAFSAKRGQAALYLQDEGGSAHRVIDDDLIDMIACQGVQPHLVLLVACQSATRSTSDALLGLGPKLVIVGVPAVIAMQDVISVETARRFSATFYRRLLAQSQVDLAVNQARATLLTGGRPDAAVPVLFMRLKSGRLWQEQVEPDATPAASAPQVLPPPEPVPPQSTKGFVGREAELAYFADKLAQSHLAIITGMPGVGKTYLASTLATRTHEPEKIFWHTFHQDESLQEMIWRLAGFLYWRGQKGLWQTIQNAWQTDSQSPPQALLLDYMFQMLRGHGYLLCFDDLHFVSDDPLLDQLFAQRLRLACQEGKLRLIATAHSVPKFVRVNEFKALSGLSLQDTIKLFECHSLPVTPDEQAKPKPYTIPDLLEINDLLVTDLVTNLHARTEGNPHLLTLAAEALKRSRNPARFVQHLFEDQNIERFLTEQIDDNLSVKERAAMNAVAILLGHSGTCQAIETILGSENMRHTLNGLSQRHLLNLTSSEVGPEYGMNTIVRHYYYDGLTVLDRQAMHRRAGEYYETQEPNILKAARHFERAGDIEQAARLATTAVRASINQGQTRTLKMLLERFSSQQVDRQQWVEINLALGDIQTFLEERALARKSYQIALDNIPLLPGSLEMKSKVTLPKVWDKLEDRPKKIDLATIWDKLQGSDERDSPEVQSLRVRAYRNMGKSLRHESPQQTLEWFRRGLEALAESDDLTLERAIIYLWTGHMQVDLGDHGTALETYKQALAILPKGPSRWRASALTGLGNVCISKGDIEQSIPYYLRALEISQQLHDHFQTMRLWHNLGIGREITGDWEEAAASYQQSLTLAEQLGQIGQQVNTENSLGVLRTKQGDHESAMVHLSRSIELARTHNLGIYWVGVLTSLSELGIEMEDWGRVQAYLEEAESLALELDVKYLLIYIYFEWAQFHLASGNLQTALDNAERAVSLAHTIGSDIAEGIGRRVLAQVLWADGQSEKALDMYARSLALLADRDPYEVARTNIHWGQALIASGDTERGIDLVQQAQATFAHLGARRDLAVANTILASKNTPPKKSTVQARSKRC